MTVPANIWPTLLGVAVLTVVTTVVLAAYRVPRIWSPAIAIARGAVQLAVISVILTGVITSPYLIATALAVMFSVAATVATGRIGWSLRSFRVMSTSIAAGAAVAAATVFTTGALEFTTRYALALGAIIIGNSMTVATLTGRLFTGAVIDHWEEVEGWLALGAPPRTSTLQLARRAVRNALIPAIDQTKTTGLVVLPGAFVGAIFGGLSPVEAGRFQIIVLAAILAAGSITAVLIVTWLGPISVKPQPTAE